MLPAGGSASPEAIHGRDQQKAVARGRRGGGGGGVAGGKGPGGGGRNGGGGGAGAAVAELEDSEVRDPVADARAGVGIGVHDAVRGGAPAGLAELDVPGEP